MERERGREALWLGPLYCSISKLKQHSRDGAFTGLSWFRRRWSALPPSKVNWFPCERIRGVGNQAVKVGGAARREGAQVEEVAVSPHLHHDQANGRSSRD